MPRSIKYKPFQPFINYEIAFTIDKNDLERTKEVLNKIKDEWQAGNIQIDENIAKVFIVGAGMVDRPGIAATMFETIGKANFNIKMISTSEIKISCLVDKEDAQKCLKTLHDVFELGCNEVAKVEGDLPPEM